MQKECKNEDMEQEEISRYEGRAKDAWEENVIRGSMAASDWSMAFV